MEHLTQRVTQHWSSLGLAARMWWAAFATVGIAAVLVLSATSVVDATSHVSPSATVASGHQFQADLTRAELAPIILGTA